jgi:cytochrome P450
VAVKAAVDLKEKLPARATIFHELLRPDSIEGRSLVPSIDDLVEEALSLVSAGSETTGNALDITTYYVLSNGEIYSKLVAELERSFPDPSLTLGFVSLEKLPYLVCLI